MSAKHKQVDANAITPEQWVAILNEDFKTHREFMGPSYENAVVDVWTGVTPSAGDIARAYC